MNAGATTTDMITALVRLREALQGAVLPLDLPGAEAQRAARAEMVDQLEDYVLPRLIQIDAPLLAVVGGSTGAGKSTLVNSLVGTRVTEPGVLRPTTRSPVLVHNPADADWFDQDRILPDLARTSRATGDPGALQLVPSEQVPVGLAILDAPDIDSVEERNRTLAAQLLAAADLWLFVTSAARYADQVPWDFLKAAADRSTAVAVVLDRTPPEAVEEVSGHLARMLSTRGLRDSRCSRSSRGRSTTTVCCRRRRSPRSAAGWTCSRRTRMRARRWSSRPWTARSAAWPGVPTSSRTPPPSRPRWRRGFDSTWRRRTTR